MLPPPPGSMHSNATLHHFRLDFIPMAARCCDDDDDDVELASKGTRG